MERIDSFRKHKYQHTSNVLQPAVTVPTELIWFGSKAHLMKLRQLDIMSLNLYSVAVEPVDSVRDLIIILDIELSMRVHISIISSTCFFHLHRLRKLHQFTSSAQRLVSAIILSRVDRTSPLYLTDTTRPILSLPGHHQRRSAMTTEYDIPRTRTKFGDRAFSVAGPREWSFFPTTMFGASGQFLGGVRCAI